MHLSADAIDGMTYEAFLRSNVSIDCHGRACGVPSKSKGMEGRKA